MSIPVVMSPDPAAAFNDEAEDFDDDWGAFADDDDNNATAAAAEEDDPWGTPSVSKPSTTTKSYDDQGEPDFAGWLAAQNNAKKVLKSPLPKGLAKSSTSTLTSAKTRPIIGARANTTGSTGTMAKKVVPATKKQEVKKVVKPKDKEEEEDGWGDAWD